MMIVTTNDLNMTNVSSQIMEKAYSQSVTVKGKKHNRICHSEKNNP